MQFVIVAYDGTDEGAFERRMSVRGEHLANIKKLTEAGNVICAGGILDKNGKMIGSSLILDFPSRKELYDYLQTEPYAVFGVWQKINVDNFNTVILNNAPYTNE